ncbi:dTDP-4-dehydrorhamnose reductase [Erwinia sp. E_sp_B04_7]|uniref:dTDP-4-dehydrorhamnose reductase n=1 Tax=unclassified Erwinia TaxID=2622719 RepID=UPI0030CC3EA3
MKIVLFGKNGQLGWELQRALAPLGTLTAFSSAEADFTDPAGVVQILRELRPDAIINAAAYTAVDRAESEPQQAFLLNELTVEAIAKEAQLSGAWLVHYSTDYVFPGSGDRPWTEENTPAPLNVYGHSKLAGELAVQRHCAKHLIFRTSWVYASRGNNFARTMLRLATSRSQLSVINDQYGAPTGADLLADCTAHALLRALNSPEVAGLYHLTASGVTSWYDYACMLFTEARHAGIALTLKQPDPVPTSQYPTPAQRPLNSRLNNRHFQQTFGLTLPEWQVGVKRMLSEITTPQDRWPTADVADNKSGKNE